MASACSALASATALACFVVEVGLFLVRELLQEQERRLHAGAGREERLLRQADHGADEGAVFAELADVGQGRVVEDAFGQDDAHAPAGLQRVQGTVR